MSDSDNLQREQRPRYGDPIVPPSAIQIEARKNTTRTGHNLVDVINLNQGEVPAGELDVGRYQDRNAPSRY